MIQRTRILGTGRAVAPTCLTNDELSKRVDTTDEWIKTRTGISQRYIVDEGDDVVTSDLCAEAGRKAIEAAGLKPEDIDLLDI